MPTLVDLTTPIRDFRGKPLPSPLEDGVNHSTLADWLLWIIQWRSDQLNEADTARAFRLGTKIATAENHDGKLELRANDVSFLRRQGEHAVGAVVWGQVIRLVDPKAPSQLDDPDPDDDPDGDREDEARD